MSAVALTAISAIAAGGSGAREPSPKQVKQTCVKAGLARPTDLNGHFWMYVAEYTTGPHAALGYKLQSMPESCFGEYRRTLFANYRFKTTRKGWRTYHGLAHGGVTTWYPIDNQDFASGTYKFGETPVEMSAEWGGPENTKHTSEWGKLQQVRGRVRLRVEDLKTGSVVGHKIYSVHTKFCRHFAYYGHYSCAY